MLPQPSRPLDKAPLGSESVTIMQPNERKFWYLSAAMLLLLLVLTLFSLIHHDFSARQDESRRKIGAIYMTRSNPFYEIIDEEIRAAVENHGDVLLSRDPALSVERQTQEVRDLIDEGVSLIFLNPVDWQKMGPALEIAHAAHVPVITIDTNVQDSELVAATVESDNYAAGRSCAEHLLAHADHANILVLKHSEARSAADRVQGFRDAIAGHDGFVIVDEAECQGQLELAMPVMQEMLERHPEATAIMALNDPSALGAMAALEATGRMGTVRVYGVDGVPETKELIASGHQLVTAAQSPRSIGRDAAAAAYEILAGRTPDRHIVLPTRLLTSENIGEVDVHAWE